jgi:16S rRNA (cytosine1402-N4)-methyltransferase
MARSGSRGRIAKAIVRERARSPSSRTKRSRRHRLERRQGEAAARRSIPATRVFQALRIAVNDELGQLRGGAGRRRGILKPGGRLAVVTFHSLEDRIVKAFLTERSGNAAGGSRHAPVAIETRKPSFTLSFKGAREAGDAERADNPRARSAKLRAAIRTDAAPWGRIAA